MATMGVIRPPIILAKDKVTLGFSKNMPAIFLRNRRSEGANIHVNHGALPNVGGVLTTRGLSLCLWKGVVFEKSETLTPLS